MLGWLKEIQNLSGTWEMEGKHADLQISELIHYTEGATKPADL